MKKFGRKGIARALLCLVAAGAILCSAILPSLAAEGPDAPIAPAPSPSDKPWWEDLLPNLPDMPDLPGVPSWDDLDFSLITEIGNKVYVLADLRGEPATAQDLIDAMDMFGLFEGVYVESAQGARVAGDTPLGTGMNVVVPNPAGGDPVRIGLVVLGDANGDGQHTLADLVQAAKAFKDHVVDDVIKVALDLNRDGEINLSDLVELARILGGTATLQG